MIDTQQLEAQQQPKKPWAQSLFFLEIGSFEFVFVVLTLGLIFFLLNYLNILPISQKFPVLSFLPKLVNNDHLVPGLSPILNNYIAETIQPAFIPTKPRIGNNSNVNQQSASWEISPYNMLAVYAYITDSKTKALYPNFLKITFQHFTNTYGNNNLTQQDIAKEVQTVFILHPTKSFSCATNSKKGYVCNDAVVANNVENMLTIAQYHVGSQSAIDVSACRFFPQGPLHIIPKVTSCGN